jgi:lytic cellulose monooxygenase (C4-dehydrogenating)
MFPTARRSRFSTVRALAIVAATLALAVGGLPGVASAHGSTTDAASRNFGCWQRWGTRHQDPAMQTQDPMCWQAFRANADTMWNWMSLFREGVAGNHQGAIPNGQLCSGGRTQGGRFASLDTVGNWTARAVGRSFTMRLFDQASHGADYVRVYITRQGFNPTTQALGWNNLELVAQVGNRPASTWQQTTSPHAGVALNINVNAGSRSGRHIVYTIWQASHFDQSYYFCSDVNIA